MNTICMSTKELYAHFLECSGISTDTRKCEVGTMFFALKGATFNGNTFAKKALEDGCKYAVIDDPALMTENNPRLLLVEDVLKSLQDLAHFHRQKWGKRIVAVTGTNGKTTTKELLAAVLSTKYKILYTQGNLNNHIGVPITLLSLKEEHELAVIEMGANHPGEIAFLAQIASPDMGIITNVGKAHLEGFGSFEGVIKTKGELYDYLRLYGEHTVFVPKENHYLTAMTAGLKCIYYGKSADGLYVQGDVRNCSPYLQFSWTYKGQQFEVTTQLIGDYNLENALVAIAVGLYLGVGEQAICEALATYQPQNNRSQYEDTGKNKLIVDAYNANPTSMRKAIENFERMEFTNKMLILGDMKELGETTKAEHQAVVDLLGASKSFQRIILIGENFGQTNHSFEHYNTTKEVADLFTNQPPMHYQILIKGSNSMKLPQLIPYL